MTPKAERSFDLAAARALVWLLCVVLLAPAAVMVIVCEVVGG